MAGIHAFLRELKNVRGGPKEWTARCPAHDDRRNSFSVSARNGKVLVHCHAGCPTDRVLAAMGLTLRDLFDSPGEIISQSSSAGPICYDYRSESGELLYQVVRDKEKGFKQRRPDAGGWKYNLDGVKHVPYRLPELLASNPDATVFITEGEKDADNLAKRGLIATTNSGGAGKWLNNPDYNEPFRGRHVVILPDNDQPGEKHAQAVARILYSVAGSVKVVRLADLPAKGDLSDWLAQGRTVDELVRVVAATPQWTPLSHREVDPVEWSLEPVLALSRESKPSQIDSSLGEFGERWLDLTAVQREIARDAAVKGLKALGHSRPNRLVDSALPTVPSAKQLTDDSKKLYLADPEPWPEAVEGGVLLNEITAAIASFISAAPEVHETVALWILYSHCFDSFDISPLLAITSPEKRCGKSTLLDLISAMVPRALPTSNITVSALFRTVEQCCPVLLIDEGDSFLRDSDELRGVLNSGHRKGAAYVIRTVGEAHEPRRFKTWCPKAVALIGALPDTLEDRAVKLKLKRKSATERKRRLRIDGSKNEFEHLCRRSARWATDMAQHLADIDPDLPSEITNDRARDNWRPLVAIADAAGGDWPQRARDIALRAAGCPPASESAAAMILTDMEAMFGELGDRVESSKVIEYLLTLEERPWGEWRNGKPLTATGLARLLKPFEIVPEKWREGTKCVRGYHRERFLDAFGRYIPQVCDTPLTVEEAETATTATGCIISSLEEGRLATVSEPVAGEVSCNSLNTNGVAAVAAQPRLFADGNGVFDPRDHEEDGGCGRWGP